MNKQSNTLYIIHTNVNNPLPTLLYNTNFFTLFRGCRLLLQDPHSAPGQRLCWNQAPGLGNNPRWDQGR